MDILAHALWVGAGATVLKRKQKIKRNEFWGAITLSVVPDIPLHLPIFFWALSPSGSFKSFFEYIFSTPGTEPKIPETILLVSHHLHCIMHSVVILFLITMFIWKVRKRFLFPLVGWWSHIIIDIFTHSKDYYAVPLFYPFSDKAFDGIAWNNPIFLLINYFLLVVIYFYLLISRNKQSPYSNQR